MRALLYLDSHGRLKTLDEVAVGEVPLEGAMHDSGRVFVCNFEDASFADGKEKLLGVHVGEAKERRKADSLSKIAFCFLKACGRAPAIDDIVRVAQQQEQLEEAAEAEEVRLIQRLSMND